MNDNHEHCVYYGNIKNLIDFFSYVLNNQGYKPATEINFAELAPKWAEDSGIALIVEKTMVGKDKNTTRIIEVRSPTFIYDVVNEYNQRLQRYIN